LVAIKPTSNLVESWIALTGAVLTAAARAAGGTIKVILVVHDAGVAASLGSRANYSTKELILIASLGVVAGDGLANDVTTLLIARCALPTGALETIAAILAIIGMLICRAASSVTGAGFLGITIAAAGTADRTTGREAAGVGTAILIARIALGIATELACLGIAAAVVAAAIRSTAIAVFTALNNAVTALTTHNSIDIAVVR
jgi:hypothetical protein